MSEAIQIRMGGYGPPTTTHSRALKFIGDRLEAQFGDRVDVKYIWNIMDFGYRSSDIMWLTECGILTLSYQSTSYLSKQVPELGFVDLPFLFPDLDAARAAYDGALGKHLTGCIEAKYNFRVLGYFENGFRHISNRLRPIHTPEDLAGMRVRMLFSDIHARTFELLGAEPLQMDLTEAIEMVKAGTLDAQENPLANTATYGVHKYHPYHTLSGHFYLSRGIWSHRDTIDAWPDDLRAGMAAIIPDAVAYQRGLAVEEEDVARRTIEDEGCEIVELTADAHAAFVAKVAPLREAAYGIFGDAMFEML
ncbi:MAG: TRAP transporter substrate-binding protein [Alphaproteobacteria bacterium]|nr:TRAP transporter substrate-binding protein [Alphaproteobacteria bacterium]